MSVPSLVLSSQEWATLYRRDDGEQQPISPVEREFGAESHGRKHGLELIRVLLEGMNDPHLSYPTVHVAGSKGKGSTVAITSSILRAAGYRVGTYTSPSLTKFGERIQVNEQPLSDDDAERHIRAMRPLLNRLQDRARFFEASTAIAFRHFAESAVDIAVIEVGMGGRLDATNVVIPEVSVITSIELEHTQVLGDTVAEIATEKAGIIKPGIPLVTAVSDAESLEPIQRICGERGSSLWRLGTHFGVKNLCEQEREQFFDLWMSPDLPATAMPGLKLALPGVAQSSNGSLAVVAAQLLRPRFGRITDAAIRQGLCEARWPGRLELVPGSPRVLLDVAHTPASARQLRRHLARFFGGVSKTLVIGMLRDKKIDEVAAELAPAFDHIIVAPIKWFRSLEGELLQSAFLAHAGDVEVAPSISAGVKRAMKTTPPDGLVVLAGSLFAVGEAKRRFGWV